MASWKKALVTFLVYYAILFIGAAIIMYIEANELKSRPVPVNITEPLFLLIEKELNVTANESVINKVIAMAQQITDSEANEKDLEWRREISWSTLYKWRYFTHITLTTLGYGDVVPLTDGGRIFVIIYGTIGIPVNIIFITTIGTLLSRLFEAAIRACEKHVFKMRSAELVELKTSILLLACLVLWLALGALVSTRTMNWSWTEGFYAAFVRMSTIGYGDYKISFQKVKHFGEFIALYTNIGLAIAAGVFDALSKWMQPKKIIRKISQIKKNSGGRNGIEANRMGHKNEALELGDIAIERKDD